MSIDFTRLPQGQMEWSELVEHLRDTGDDYETDYLEVKSDVDPTIKPGRAKITKYILGSANRMPDIAGQHFTGHGVMVLGVGNGAIPGVPKIDEKDLKNYLSAYLGKGARPRWWTERVDIPGVPDRYVLIIVIAPPQNGDPIFPCRKEFPDPSGKGMMLMNGAVYLRRSSETITANADEIDALSVRLTAGYNPKAEPSVTVNGSVYRVRCSREIFDRHIKAVREMLGTPVERQSYFESTSLFTERRSAAEFRAEVDEWEREFANGISILVNDVIGAFVAPIEIQIVNHGGAYISQPEVYIDLDGKEIRFVDINDHNEYAIAYELPDLPAKWGTAHHWTDFAPLAAAAPYDSGVLGPVDSHGVVSIRKEDNSLRMSFRLKDLRVGAPPSRTETDFVLITTENAGVKFSGRWKLTGADHTHIYSAADVELEVVEIDITENVEKVLRASLPEDD
ncbi:ATP-binding protein [Nocardia salmonicida]|uniref:ATP-binding protein n=1 Tax=Nocardia salmonicida TaxID=53431 RepID=UPI003CF613EE